MMHEWRCEKDGHQMKTAYFGIDISEAAPPDIYDSLPPPAEKIFSELDVLRHDHLVHNRVFEPSQGVAPTTVSIARLRALLRVITTDSRGWLRKLGHAGRAVPTGDVETRTGL